MEKMNNFSLLWPENVDRDKYQDIENLSQRCEENLGLKKIAQELSYNEKHYYSVRKLLLNLCNNPEIINYRLDILKDFNNNPELINKLEDILRILLNPKECSNFTLILKK